jgi:hypothetical protein
MAGSGTEGTTSYYGGWEDDGWYYLKTLWMPSPDFQGVFPLADARSMTRMRCGSAPHLPVCLG